jgi:hypothetical protein
MVQAPLSKDKYSNEDHQHKSLVIYQLDINT